MDSWGQIIPSGVGLQVVMVLGSLRRDSRSVEWRPQERLQDYMQHCCRLLERQILMTGESAAVGISSSEAITILTMIAEDIITTDCVPAPALQNPCSQLMVSPLQSLFHCHNQGYCRGGTFSCGHCHCLQPILLPLRMDHVISSPVHMDVRTRGKRRRVTLLSPEALSTKKRKTTDRASRKKLKGVTGRTITTTQHLEKPQPGEGPSFGAQEPTVSFTHLDPRADVPSEPATTTHEMVLKRASTKRLLRLLGEFLCRRCHLLKDLTPAHPLRWIHVVDDFILFTGIQA
ncbi:hypothetical protein NFI96_025514 [Prochilodus magdalenae]|nr:hypothetical protein NFI96_025514 [Prochilodus magdalenae]